MSLISVHSYYSLRYGTMSIEKLLEVLKAYGYTTAVLTDINNSSGMLDFIRLSRDANFNGIAGIEFRNGDTLLFTGIAKNNNGFKELNDLLTYSNLNKAPLPERAPGWSNVYVVYPLERNITNLKENEYIGVRVSEVKKVLAKVRSFDKYICLQPVTFIDRAGYKLNCQLRAINNNILYSQLQRSQVATRDELLITRFELLNAFRDLPQIIMNTDKILADCSFDFEFREQKNKKIFTASRYDDKQLLEKLANEGMLYRYGGNNIEARKRISKELTIIDQLGFSSYFLITWDIVRYAMGRGFYHVGRGSGANSIVAYCLKITDVCPIELDLYFERFLNPKRKSPPDFDIDFSWDERDDIHDYIFKRYGRDHVALMGAMNTFKDRSIIRELGKVYGLPKAEIDRLIENPADPLNRHEISAMILAVYSQIEDFPNLRTIHSSGILISELPITYYTALDLPPKNLPTAQFDMYTAEVAGFEKFDILSQRGIGHIKEAVEIVKRNRGTRIDVHEVTKFKLDPVIKAQLKSGDTIGCFYVESPAMRQLLKKLSCEEYLTLVAASSIIRPGVAKSGMMKAYIERFHDPTKAVYLHPVMEEQLKETYGVMVYQEDVLKVGIHFGGLDAADADVLRRMMSGKSRNKKHLLEIEAKYYDNCKRFGYADEVAKEVWRQIESFAGYSFSKAHSASFAVESFQSLFLKSYYPLEFMVAVINNFGGFYRTSVYVNEAKKAGANIHLPCINKSEFKTVIYGKDIYLGLIHIKGLESTFAQMMHLEREQNGKYVDMENVIARTGITLEQLTILIRIGALRFTGKDKKQLLWEGHALLYKTKLVNSPKLFMSTAKEYKMPCFQTTPIEDAYDEIELLGWPVTFTSFDMLKTEFRGDFSAKELMQHVGDVVRVVGDFVAAKYVPTARGTMAFGSFTDTEYVFFDTTSFPQSFKEYPFKGNGPYLIEGKVVQEFGQPSIEVARMARISIKADPRTE